MSTTSEPLDPTPLGTHLDQIHNELATLIELNRAEGETLARLTALVGECLTTAQGSRSSGSDHEQGNQWSEPDGTDAQRQLWDKYAAKRPELTGVQVDQAPLPQRLTCLTYRLDADARESLEAELREQEISWQPPRDEELESALTGVDDGQADAVRTLLTLAQHDTALGQIVLGTDPSCPWLVSFDSQKYKSYRNEIRETLTKLDEAARSENADRTQDAVIWLDQVLRQLIPVEHGPDGRLRIAPPATGSTWEQALNCSFQAAKRIGAKVSPPFVVGIPKMGIKLKDAEKEHHIDFKHSPVQATHEEQKRVILWPLSAWNGRGTNKRNYNVTNWTKVVYG